MIPLGGCLDLLESSAKISHAALQANIKYQAAVFYNRTLHERSPIFLRSRMLPVDCVQLLEEYGRVCDQLNVDEERSCRYPEVTPT